MRLGAQELCQTCDVHGSINRLLRPVASAVVKASAASFGFVDIHPLADDKGRVHRLLIKDVLRRDDAGRRG